MSEFQRYAIYYLPDDPDLARFGAAWLGWDVEAGSACPQPLVPDIAAITAAPRKYGFHGTLKPPFRLAEGTTSEGLERAVRTLATRAAPVQLEGLHLARLGHFLALVPSGDTNPLADLAFRIVSELDPFRAPAPPEELERRRAKGLTPAQDALLLKWGYPYVADEFRFHLTLTGRLEPEALDRATQAATDLFLRLPSPFDIRSIALAGEDAEGRFHLLHRYTLTG